MVWDPTKSEVATGARRSRVELHEHGVHRGGSTAEADLVSGIRQGKHRRTRTRATSYWHRHAHDSEDVLVLEGDAKKTVSLPATDDRVELARHQRWIRVAMRRRQTTDDAIPLIRARTHEPCVVRVTGSVDIETARRRRRGKRLHRGHRRLRDEGRAAVHAVLGASAIGHDVARFGTDSFHVDRHIGDRGRRQLVEAVEVVRPKQPPVPVVHRDKTVGGQQREA